MSKRYRLCMIGLAISLLADVPTQAQFSRPAAQTRSPAPSKELEARIAELPALLNRDRDFEAFFAVSFKEQVTKAQFEILRAELAQNAGRARSATISSLMNADAATLLITFDKGTIGARIAIDPAQPHQVTGLLLTGFTSAETSLKAVRASLAGLRGRTGFAFARLGEGPPKLIAADRANQPFAVGSAFKLLILAELIRATNAGERQWDDMVAIDGPSIAGGKYSSLPIGTQISLDELAEAMIAVSDNSATDLLFRLVGRAKVEAMMEPMGVAHAERNRPMLSTIEMFTLKGVPGLSAPYLARDEAGRRAMLAEEIARTPPSAIDSNLFRDGRPILIEELEWFLSPVDLVHVMDWIRHSTEGPKGETARAILSKNAGISPWSAQKWSWVGYKGGSEPGVMNMTLLLRATNGQWYALTASWNDPDQDVDQPRLAGLLSRAAELVAPR